MTCLICAKTPCYGMLGHFWERFHWACMTARHAQPKTLRARLRLLWNDFVIHALLHRGGERCQDCGRGYALWKAEGDLWARVMGSGGLLCIGCFARRVYAQPWGRDGVTVILAAHQPVAAESEPILATSPARLLDEHRPYDDAKEGVQRCFTCCSMATYSNGVAVHQEWPCAAYQVAQQKASEQGESRG